MIDHGSPAHQWLPGWRVDGCRCIVLWLFLWPHPSYSLVCVTPTAPGTWHSCTHLAWWHVLSSGSVLMLLCLELLSLVYIALLSMAQFPRLLYYPIRWLISSALSSAVSFRAVFPDTIGPTQQIVENVLGSKYPGWTLFMDDWPFVLNRVPTPTSALALGIEMGTFRNSSFHTVMLDNAVPKCFSWIILYLLGL